MQTPRPTDERRRDVERRVRLRERVKSEFGEMPGMNLTVEQAGRLLALDTRICGRVLDELVHDGFLRLEPDGSYGRFDRGA
jgi:hypothetical protein